MVTDQATREAIEYILTRGVVQVEKESELRHLLNSGEALRIKLGVDPSHYDLTIGHAVVFRKLRQFQRLGHRSDLQSLSRA
jgi:tyrosyl-tRNA synthetase